MMSYKTYYPFFSIGYLTYFPSLLISTGINILLLNGDSKKYPILNQENISLSNLLIDVQNLIVKNFDIVKKWKIVKNNMHIYIYFFLIKQILIYIICIYPA